MNTGQMLMVLGAMTLLSFVALSVNSMLVNKTTTMLETEANLNAVSLAQSMLDEVLTTSFDAVTAAGTKVYDSTGFTAAGSLGPSSSEASSVPLPEPPDTAVPYKSLKYYNDIDDYDQYRRIAFASTMGPFSIIDSVFYVKESNPDLKSAAATFYKKIVVTVRHRNMYPPGVTYNQWTGKYYMQLSDVAVYRRYF